MYGSGLSAYSLDMRNWLPSIIDDSAYRLPAARWTEKQWATMQLNWAGVAEAHIRKVECLD